MHQMNEFNEKIVIGRHGQGDLSDSIPGLNSQGLFCGSEVLKMAANSMLRLS